MSHPNSKEGSFSGLPFGSFLNVLREAGFFISVRDITEFTTIFQQLLDPAAESITPELQKSQRERLKLFLAPVICRSPTEQTKFYQLFDDFFITQKTDPPSSQQPPKPTYWKYILYALFGVCALVTIVLVIRRRPVPPPKPGVHLTTPEDCLWVDHPIQLSSVARNDDPSMVTQADTPLWSFGDGTALAKAAGIGHIFKKCGTYRIHLLRSPSSPDSANVYDSLDLGVFPAGLLSQRGFQDLVVGDTVGIIAEFLDSSYRRGKATWIVTNDNDQKQQTYPFIDTVLNYVCSQKGAFTATLLPGIADCDLGPSFSFGVAAPRNAVLNVIGSDPAPPGSYQPVTGWIIGLLLGFLCCTAIAIYVGTRKRKLLLAGSPPSEDPPGMGQPLEIPMNSRNARITRLQDQSRVSALLLQRIESDTQYLDIPKTVRKSIDNRGLLVPRYSRRYKDRNYLILIDGADTAGSQYTHLFGYLARTFLNDNVGLSYYYYYDQPDVLYGENRSIPIYLKDVSDKHYGDTLLIFSNGESLIDPSLPTVRWSIKSMFDSWTKKLLVTPVPALDWGVNEKILAGYFSLLPADVKGLLNLVKYINEDLPGPLSLRARDWNTYAAESVNVQNIGALREYLHDEDLFQWVCGLSVYHRLRWEVIIELGKTILTQAGVIAKLNYTNLLKIARIRWIEEGAFPESIRFALLKALSVPNELIARKAMLGMFSESDNVVGPQSFSYREKMVQRYTDSFILYAGNSPNRELYREDADKFISLWDGGKIADSSLSHYLTNPLHQWETPLNDPDGKKSHVNMGEYIRKAVPRRPRPLLYAAVAIALLMLTLLAALSRYPDRLYDSSFNRYLHLVDAYQVAFTPQITLANDTCLKKFADTLATALTITEGHDSTRLIYYAFNLPETQTKIPLRRGNLTFILGNARDSISATVPSDTLYQRYDLSVVGPLCKSRPKPSTVFIQYDPVLNRDSLEKIRLCLASANFIVPGLQGIKLTFQKGDNCIRYFNDSLKSAAEDLKNVLKRCAGLDFRIERSGLRVRTDSLEVWVNGLSTSTVASASCPLVTIGQIAGLKQGIPYYSADFKNQLQLSNSQIATLGSTYIVDTGIRSCQGQYTLYLRAPVQANASPIFRNRDTVTITITNGNSLRVNPGSRYISAGDYFPSLFLVNKPIALTGIDPSDTGYYRVEPTGDYWLISKDSVLYSGRGNPAVATYYFTRGYSYGGGIRIYALNPSTYLAILLTGWGKFACQFRGSGNALATPTISDAFHQLTRVFLPGAPLQGSILRASPGLTGFDVNNVLTADQAKAFKNAGYDFCIRTIPRTQNLLTGNLNNAEALDILNAGLALMAIQHVALPGWRPNGILGSTSGAYAANYSSVVVGLHKGTTIWCDLEGVATGTPVTDILDYCQAWYNAVLKGGYAPGLYVGYDAGLTPSELSTLPFQHFWRSYNGPEVGKHGFQLLQKTEKTLNGITFGPNTTQVDSLGLSVLWLKK